MHPITENQARNAYIIKREFIRELDKGLGKIKKFISKTYSGLLTNIPSNVFYYMYFRGKVRGHVINQIKISLRMAFEYDGTNMDALLDKYKGEYLANDLVTLHVKRDHPALGQLQEITLNNLHSRVPILKALIASSGDTYNELVRNAFSSESEVRHVLEIQFIFIDQWIEFLAENKDALAAPKIFNVDIPIDSDTIFKVIVDTYEYGMARLDKKLDAFFSGEEVSD